MVIMLIFGVVGYLMKRYDYEAAPLVLALVLGPMMENALRQSMVMSRGSFGIFFTRPVSMGIMGLALALLAAPLFSKFRGKIPQG